MKHSPLAVSLAALFFAAANARAADDAYARALEKYKKGDFASAASILSAKQRKTVGDLNLLGWCYLKSDEPEKARAQFERSLARDASVYNSYCGVGYSYFQKGDFAAALKAFEKGAAKDPECAAGKASALAKLNGTSAPPTASAAAAETAIRRGDNVAAAKEYVQIIDEGRDEGDALRKLLDLYGWERYQKGRELELPQRPKPATRAMPARTHGDYLEVLEGGAWKVLYMKGVNLGPARPNEFPSTPPQDVKVYLGWLDQIAAMNSNTVRVYTILPPAFYQALKTHNAASPRKIWLLQEVWLSERDDEQDLYAKSWTDEFRAEIKDNIDVLHGHADIPYRPGHAWGVYTADVSGETIAIGVGRELEPSTALVTNARNPEKTKYDGAFLSGRGNPTEVWFARMSDYAATYEAQTYNAQHPITLINWPPLDPMTHPTEASYAEELAFRRKRGERVDEAVHGYLNDADVVSVDVNAFRASREFPAGYFASFHVYTHWPNFLFTDPDYPKVRDAEGPDRYLGYLLDLKKHYQNMPLLVAEYGIATSWGTAHLHPDGWGNGGQSEADQARILLRMTKNIQESRCAGGIVFEWQDEWWKRVSDYFTRPFSSDINVKPLWLNLYDPEEMFGILGYRSPPPIPLLRGREADWAKAVVAAQSRGKASKPGEIRDVRMAADQTFLYIRVDLEPGAGLSAEGLALLLNTLPGKAGARKVPGLGASVGSGVNFLVEFSSVSARVSIAENYNPNMWVFDGFGGKRLWRKDKMTAALEDASPFSEIVTETNQPQWSRDGTMFPSQFASRSNLKYGSGDPAQPGYSNQAAWHLSDGGMLELRLPWGLMYFMNPGGKLVFGGNEKGMPFGRVTDGVSVTAVRRSSGSAGAWNVTSSLPEIEDGRFASPAPVYSWTGWRVAPYEAYLKPSYDVLKDIFGKIDALPR